ncbi:MAG: methyltransferase domain-containing protein [Rhodobacter sp.]|nr:methyltransferase domain-containing protein [Rhodobacter sp.]
MASNNSSVLAFYDTHPISETQILEKLAADGVDLATLTEDILQDYDQDHFGGVQANDALARAGGVNSDSLVLDVCCGLGGPARYFGQKFGCRVEGVDMTASRVEGAKRLTELAGLSDRVSFTCGNALDLPFADNRFDVLISQEAFCHIPDKPTLVAECVRSVRPGGRIAFTDILATGETTPETRQRLTAEMTFNELATAAEYRDLFTAQNCEVLGVDDLGSEWRDILIDRLAMYRSLGDQTVRRFGQAHFDKWDRAYSFFVGCYGTGELSGGRFSVQRLT